MDFPKNASLIASTKDRLQLCIRPCWVKGSTRAMLETARCALIRPWAPWCGRQVSQVRAASVCPSYDGGNVNQEYGDIVGAIASHTDDAIFFGHLLCADLRQYGLKIADQFRKLFKEPVPRVTEVDFTHAQASQLLPKDEDYSTWFTAFRPAPAAKRKWWQRDD